MSKNRLADKLRELRKAHGYKQADIAAVLDIVQQTYSHYETGRNTPDTDTLYKLASFYNIRLDDLMRLSMDESDLAAVYEIPPMTKSAENLTDYLEFFNAPHNKKKYQHLSNLEKELLYFFEKLSDRDKRELIELAKIKLQL